MSALSASAPSSPLAAFLADNPDPDYAALAEELFDVNRRDPLLARQMIHAMRVACELRSWEAMIARTRIDNPELAAQLSPVAA